MTPAKSNWSKNLKSYLSDRVSGKLVCLKNLDLQFYVSLTIFQSKVAYTIQYILYIFKMVTRSKFGFNQNVQNASYLPPALATITIVWQKCIEHKYYVLLEFLNFNFESHSNNVAHSTDGERQYDKFLLHRNDVMVQYILV